MWYTDNMHQNTSAQKIKSIKKEKIKERIIANILGPEWYRNKEQW